MNIIIYYTYNKDHLEEWDKEEIMALTWAATTPFEKNNPINK